MGCGSCCDGTYSKLRHNRCIQIFVFLVIFGLNAADLGSDWMLYHDVRDTEEGLVFGPVESGIVTALLVFSISGAVLFLFEVVNLGLEIFREKAFINVDAASAIVVWFEDVPQIAINVIIVACREEAISFFQLSKASVVIVGAIVRMIIASVRYCRRKSSKKNVQSCTILRCLMLIGSVIMVFGSAIVFTFTQAKWSPDGKLVFPTPKNLWKGEFDEDHYFRGAGIYVNIPKFNDNDENLKDWIRLMDINDIKQGMIHDKLITLNYDDDSRILTFGNVSTNGSAECYIHDRRNGKFSQIHNCTYGQIRENSTSTILTFIFKYVMPQNHLLLGDIIYNAKITTPKQKCIDISAKNGTEKMFSLRYFKAKPEIPYKYHLFVSKINTTTETSLYNAERHLVDISEAWKTGFIGCESSGSVSPHLNTGLQMPCHKS